MFFMEMWVYMTQKDSLLPVHINNMLAKGDPPACEFDFNSASD